jgi:hypothetical protein
VKESVTWLKILHLTLELKKPQKKIFFLIHKHDDDDDDNDDSDMLLQILQYSIIFVPYVKYIFPHMKKILKDTEKPKKDIRLQVS